MTREYTTSGEAVVAVGTATYGHPNLGPNATAHLTDYQRAACEALSHFHVQTEQEVRSLLSMWVDRWTLYEPDIRVIVAELVGWQGAYTRRADLVYLNPEQVATDA